MLGNQFFQVSPIQWWSISCSAIITYLLGSSRLLSYDMGCPLSRVLTKLVTIYLPRYNILVLPFLALTLTYIHSLAEVSSEEYKHAVTAHNKGQQYILKYNSTTRNGKWWPVHFIVACLNAPVIYIFDRYPCPTPAPTNYDSSYISQFMQYSVKVVVQKNN